MANIPLQSISFPGLSDKYTTPTVDATLTQTGAAADAKKTGDEIGAIKNDLSEFPNGNYPQMGAGYANQLVSSLKKADSTPYNFRRIPYDATLEEVKKIVGGTIVNNQLVGTTDTSITVQSGHKAYKSISGTTSVFTSDGTAIIVTGGTDIVIDLTQMLGTSIADYVLSLETATAGAGVAWLKKHFPKQFDAGYQAYDAGSLQSVSGLTEHRMVGFNLFNSEAGTVRIIGGMQYQITGTYTALSLDGTTITPDSNGKFTPTNSGTLTVTGGNATDTCVHFVWDGEKDGEYEPYKTWSYALDDSITLRGIPKVDASGNLYYDGDEYLPDGMVNRRYGIVDLGTLNWTMGTFNDITYFTVDSSQLPDLKKPTSSTGDNNYRCGKYALVKASGVTGEFVDKSFFVYTNGVLYFRDDSYNDATAFKTGVTGVYMVYEKATVTIENADPYTTPQIISPDGTEEYIYEDGAFELPVGHTSDYPVNVSGQLDDILDTPSANGTYVLKATVADGAVTYSWVADA